MENVIVAAEFTNQVAKLNITFAGQNGDLRDPVPYDAPNEDILRWTAEALQNGDIAGIPATANPDLNDFVVDRFTPTEERPYHALFVRPKTPFG